MYILLVLYIALFLLSLKKGEEILSINNTKIIKGFCALNVLLSHLALNVYNISAFYPFKFLGNISVGIFLFLSGYGLSKSLQKRKNITFKYIFDKIVKIVLPYIIVIIILYFSLYLKEMSILNYLKLIFLGKIIGPFWYMSLLIILYILFFIIYQKGITNKRNTFFTIITIIYVVIACIFNITSHWFVSVLCFPLGLLYSTNEKKTNINIFRYKLIIILLFIITFGLKNIFAYLSIFNFAILDNILQIINCLTVCFCVIIFLSKVSLKCKIMEYIGSISYYIYLLHPVIMEYIIKENISYNNWRIFIVLALTIVFSQLFHFIVNLFFKVTIKKNSQE